MAILSPSLLAADPLNLGKEIQRAEAAGAQWLHVDVMDGCFVPNLSSFTYSTVAAMGKATNLTLDVHLMIEKPIRYVENFCRAGADYLTIHVEADSRENIRSALEKIRALGVRPGIVLKPGTPAEAAEEFLPLVDMVLVMTVEPGFGALPISGLHDAESHPAASAAGQGESLLPPGGGRGGGQRNLPHLHGKRRRCTGGRLRLLPVGKPGSPAPAD